MKAHKKSTKSKPKIASSRIQEAATMEYAAAQKIGAFDAKTHLAAILSEVSQGQKFVVTKHGKPIAQIIPIDAPKTLPVPGLWRGQIWMAEDFDAPLKDFEEYMK